MRALATEPLVHFFLFAAILVAARSLWEPADDGLVVDDALVRALREAAGPEVVADEVLIENWIREELLYREALKAGLHLGDPVVRRRMVQKMEAVLASGSADPSEAELREYLTTHAAEFATERAVTFTHRFFSVDRRETAEADATEALQRLDAGDESPVGDPFLLGAREVRRSAATLDQRFGAGFGEQVLALNPETWTGPVRSRFGFHVVRVEAIYPGSAPDLETVRAEVEASWREDARREQVRSAVDELRQQTPIRRAP